ncbi:MAG TPA: serine/threonine-protein kinase [Ktedonobacteraceae bacterium]|jgi:serine/threonine protein kinase|nr:serine/threonine-protein kinase [Ktedonobacteraceae bacterium]
MIVGERVGQQLGEYRLLRLLGRSAFAEVYYAEHRQDASPAAVKVLNWRYIREGTGKFLDQACTLSQLEHPHIVRVLDVGIDGNVPYMVMSYAPNGTLRQQYPKHTPMPLEKAVTYAQQVADALQYVHDQQLIHRDIKPHNMLLGPENQVWLSDFGIAMLSHSIDPHWSSEIDFEGTVVYAAPEQLQGHPQRSSDQYALGIVVYEWLTGEWPFTGSFAEIARQHLFDLPPALRRKGLHIPREVERVVLKSLEKDPRRRFPTVREFASSLADASADYLDELSGATTEKQAIVTAPLSESVYPQTGLLTPTPDTPQEIDTGKHESTNDKLLELLEKLARPKRQFKSPLPFTVKASEEA